MGGGSATYPATLSKSGAGNVLFGGLITQTANNSAAIDFSVGNPTVEMRGGINASAYTWPQVNFKSGTGQWKFTTNNQTLGGSFFRTNPFDASILISGAITLTLSKSSEVTAYNGVINGDNVNSKFLMNTNATIQYNPSTQPMATGILDTFTNLNTWIYGLNNQDVKGNPTAGQFQQYRNLTLNGTGTKTLQGNINVQNTYTLTSPATLALNGYTKTP